ncbi:MAG: NADP-dependent isocitrate dehydrogenase [Chloroflexota bacterium]
MAEGTPVTVAYGDGIGPEIMEASLRIIDAAGARLQKEVIEIGQSVYLRGQTSGIEPSSWESLRRTRVFYKAPITTPQGGGFKSLNVTVRKTMGLYANVRPCVAYSPYVDTKHPGMDVVIVRENEEDVYGGIEHRQTDEVTQCLKLISRPGTEKIVRYAFEYARSNKRGKVTCFTKDNIMKITDGLFHQVFDEVAAEYPDIENEHWIVDIGGAKLADTPEAFDVMAAQIAGSVGLAGSANVGEHVSMFEAIHGSAPRRAGQNLANPSGLLLGGVMMLVHLGQVEAAERVHNGWLRTIEDGIHTYDIFKDGVSKQKVGTREFADAVIARLGEKPLVLNPMSYGSAQGEAFRVPGSTARTPARKALVGVDVFVDWRECDRSPDVLAGIVQRVNGDGVELAMISNRGTKVWPDGSPWTFCTDHWRCRFRPAGGAAGIAHSQIVALLARVSGLGLDFIKTENLYTFDGKPGFSLGQGE